MKEIKRVLSLVMCCAMLLGYLPAPAFAQEDSQSGWCEDHQEHIDCSYAPTVEAADCTHQHGEDCYAQEEHCAHVHEDCGSQTLFFGCSNQDLATTNYSGEEPPAHKHTYNSVVTAPTCKDKGYTTYTCACGDSYADSYVDSVGHDHLATVTYPAGIDKGYTEYICSRCSDSYRTLWLDIAVYEGKTIACVGDSITAAYGVTKDETDYVTLLAEQLGMEYIRLGVSGTTLCTDGSRTCNIGQLTEGRLNGADVVTIAMGINDFCAAAEGYYELGDINSTDTSTIYGAARMWCERIVELRKTESLSDSQFYFVTPVICSWNSSVTSNRDWDQSKTNVHGYTLRDLCNAIMEVAALYDVAVIDLNLLSGMYYIDAEDNNTAVFGGDGVHPGEKGHEMMANALANALLQNNLRDDHPHAFGSWITTTWPSCVAGEAQRICTACSAAESSILEPNGNHRYCAAITPPTCTEQGYTTHTCACGESFVDSYVDATGEHSYDDGVCTVCGAKQEILSLRYDDHYDVSGKVVEILDAGNTVVTLEGDYLVATGIGSAQVKIDGADYAITVEKAKVNLVMVVGQSNSGNHFPNATSDVTCPPGTAYHWGYGATEPADYTQPSMGFHAPLLAELYAQSVAAGDPVKNVLLWEEGYTSKNGMSVTAWAVEKNGVINTEGTDGAAQMVRDCLAYYEQNSDKYEVVHKVVFCSHGCTDHAMETQRYIRLFTAMWERLKAEGMEYVGFLRVRGAHSLYTPENADTYYNAASSAQFEMVRTREDMFMATTLAEAWTGPASTVHSIGIHNYITVMETYGQTADYSDSYGNKASYADGVLTTTMKELYGSNNKIHYGKFGYGLIGADAAYNMYAVLNGTRAASITQTDSSGLKTAEHISSMGSTQTLNIEDLTYNLSFYPTCGSPKGTMQITVMAGDMDITENVISNETATFGTISTEALRSYVEPVITVSYTYGGRTEDVTYTLVFDHPCNSGHAYETVVTAPTCTGQGYTTHTCAICGDSYVDSYEDALGHTEVIDEAVAATCTTTGLTEGKRCSVCGTVTVDQTVIPMIAHAETTVAAVAATCTTTGLTEGKRCSVCGTVTVDQTVIPMIAHTEETDSAVAATCTATGLTEGKHCSVCGEVLVDQQTVPLAAHTEETDTAVAPTCTANGLTEGKHCSVCNQVLVSQEVVAAVGHSYNSEVTAPTCVQKGYTTHTCSSCGNSYVDSYTNATGEHSYADGVCEHCGAAEEIPAKLTVSAGNNADGKPTLKWEKLDGATEYRVYRSATEAGNFAKVFTTKGKSYTHTSAVAGKSYYYYVKAILSDGREVDSEVLKNTYILPIQEFEVTTDNNTEGKPTLKWTGVNGATEYRVYRSNSQNGNFVYVFKTTGLSYTHISATAGNSYYYYVKAIRGDGSEEDSAIVTNTCLEPDTFVITTGNNAAGKPTLKWTAAANAARYEVYRATSENGSYVKVFTTTGKSYTHTSAAAGKTYYYKVKIVAKDGTAKFSAVVKNSCLIPDAQISIVTGHNAAGKPTLKWTAIPGAERYEVYRATSENGNYVKAFSTKGTSYTNSSAQAGKTYYYKLKVYLSNGTEKTSDVVVNSCLIPEAQFSIETGNNAAGKPTMKWTAIPGADHYEVYRSTSLNGAYVKVFTTKGTSYTHTSAAAGKTYYYKLKVSLTDGTSKTSDAIPNACLEVTA